MKRLYLLAALALAAMAITGCRAEPEPVADPTVAISTPQPTLPPITPMPSPSPQPTPRPAPTLKPAEAPAELHALSFDTAMAVFGTMGIYSNEPETRFFDMPGAPELDTQTGYGSFKNQLMVPAAPVLQSLGYTIVFEDEKGLEAKLDNQTLAFNVGEDSVVRDGQRFPMPAGGKAAVWRSGAVWIMESMLPLPETYARIQDGSIITLDFTSQNDAAGRAQALKKSQAMWAAFPK